MTHFKISPSNRAVGWQEFESKHNATKQERLSLLDTAELARVTRTSKSTWEKMRVERRGPRFIKVRNLVWYRRADVDSWMAAHEIETEELA